MKLLVQTLYSMSTENSLLENDEPVNKKVQNMYILMEVRVLKMKKKPVFFKPFWFMKKKSGHDTTIETLYFQTVSDICISDKFFRQGSEFS